MLEIAGGIILALLFIAFLPLIFVGVVMLGWIVLIIVGGLLAYHGNDGGLIVGGIMILLGIVWAGVLFNE